jgi:hypothetical protein
MHTAKSQFERCYLLGQKILASSAHSGTFKVRPVGQILLLSSSYIVNKNNNFGLRQFFEGPYLSEEKKYDQGKYTDPCQRSLY